MDAGRGHARPRSSMLEWTARLISLVLAGMVTLSIIGSIAAIPSGSVGTRMGFERPEPVPQPEVVEEQPQPVLAAPEEAEQEQAAAGPAGTGTPISAAPPPEEPNDVERWLEAITYALMALVGLAALAVLLLWRAVGDRRRLADAIELLASRRNA